MRRLTNSTYRRSIPDGSGGGASDGRATGLGAAPRESLTGEGVAMTVIVRQALIAIAVAVMVVAIADFVLWETATESQPSEAPNAEMVR